MKYRRPRFTISWTAFFGSMLFLSSAYCQEAGVYDHHVHVLSPRLIADWKSTGMQFSRSDEAYNNPNRIIEQEGIAGAFLISMAHLYTTENFRPIMKWPDLERRLVAAENDFVAVCVASDPKRFVGFFSVNPLRKYAFDELKRCKANPNLTGLKLHLPACDVDLENPDHLKKLASVFSWAAANDVPVLLHLSAGEEIDVEKSRWFWQTVIQPHANLELYLAHLGSVGGFNNSSNNILLGFSRLAAENAEFRKMKIYFDLSGAIIGEDFEESPPTSAEQCQKMSEQMLRVGLTRFLFASDYPVFTVANTRANLTNRLKLTREDSTRLLRNKSPRFQD